MEIIQVQHNKQQKSWQPTTAWSSNANIQANRYVRIEIRTNDIYCYSWGMFLQHIWLAAM